MAGGPRVIAIVGATATGKTALALALAERLDGEIINADSRQVYRGMDIGTAKPTAEEQAAARHWLIDIADPGEPGAPAFTLASFLDHANAALDDVWSRGKVPIVAGGTAQYVWALLEGWHVPRVAPDLQLRAELEALAASQGAESVAAILSAEDPPSAETIDHRNVRRMIRAIEVTRATGRPFSAWQRKDAPAHDATLIGLRMSRDALYERIDRRVDAMFAAGFVEEVRHLIESGCNCESAAMSGIGYRQICEHLRGDCTLTDAIAWAKTESHRLARTQHTWFRADDARIAWLDADARDLVDRAIDVLAIQ